MMNLNSKQEHAYNIMCNGKNIFLTGSAGTGKSYIIKLFNKLNKQRKNIAVTSTTGVSALLIGGTTLHSFLGIGLGTSSSDALIMKIMEKDYLLKRWRQLDVLIIDEISMLSPMLFDKLECVARHIRHNDEPFGGIQLILSGDFCQLPCIDSNVFCNEARSWNSCIEEIVYFTEIIRQSDPVFQECLNYLRIGEVPSSVIEVLRDRIGVELRNNLGIKPTLLCPLNRDVDKINERELDRLAEENDVEFYEYEMELEIVPGVKNRRYVEERFRKNTTASEVLQLCVGAQVMLLINLDFDSGLVNGSRGVVVNFVEERPVIKFLNEEERIIDYHIWEIEENDRLQLRAKQIPLKLAYALSCHKSQGISLDYVYLDLLNVFEYGQAYVALSRVKTLEGLSITGIDLDKIKAHPKAIEFYKNL